MIKIDFVWGEHLFLKIEVNDQDKNLIENICKKNIFIN